MSKNDKRYSKKLAQKIVDKLAEGHSLEKIVNVVLKDETPSRKTIYNWMHKHDEFREKIESAYRLFIMAKINEMEYLTDFMDSGRSLKELYPHIDSERERMHVHRTRIDTLKFITGKLAPALSKDFAKPEKVEIEHTGEISGPQIQIVSYAVEPVTEKVVNSIESDSK